MSKLSKINAEHETEIIADGINKVELADKMLATEISRKLSKHYPGHLWAVNVDSNGGVVTIKAFNISFKYGYLLKLKDVQSDPTRKQCIMAGGEILERANVMRGWRRDGELPKHVDGVKEQHQPRVSEGGIVLIQ